MASIQQSLNNLFAASLGAAFAGTQTPGARDYVAKKSELKALNKQQETLEAAEMQGEIPNEMLDKFREKGLSAAERAFEIDPSTQTYEQLKAQLKKQPTIIPAYEGPEDYYGSEDYQQDIEQEAANRIYKQKREQDIANLMNRQQAAQDAKRGMQNAVADRLAVIEQLREAGVNVDNVKGIRDTKTGERVK